MRREERDASECRTANGSRSIVVYHQFDDFEAGNRQFHDGGQKHQRALLGKFLGACLFDPDQDPVGAQPLALIFVKINFVAGLCMIWRRKCS
jgi:hypothetical protein